MKVAEKIWQRWGEAVKFLMWGVAVTLVCFLLYHVVMYNNNTQMVPLSKGGRDSLMTVNVAAPLSDTLLRYDAFDVHFNSVHGVANCACYELTANELHGDAERPNEFMADERVKGCPQPTDYAGSGMDRGHLVPAADLKWNEAALQQSFLLTNICPMTKPLNEGGWAKLEEKVREWAVRDSALLVFSGPIVAKSDTTMAHSRVKVPSRYYKIVMAPCVRPMRVIAFIYPNGHCAGRLEQYAVSVDEVEQATGLDFFPTLPDDQERRLESGVKLEAWVN